MVSWFACPFHLGSYEILLRAADRMVQSGENRRFRECHVVSFCSTAPDEGRMDHAQFLPNPSIRADLDDIAVSEWLAVRRIDDSVLRLVFFEENPFAI
jgi:hypothetical protein